jgi:hypothetical protein
MNTIYTSVSSNNHSCDFKIKVGTYPRFEIRTYSRLEVKMLQKSYCDVCQNESDHEAKFCPSLKCQKCTQMGHGKPDCPFNSDNSWQPKPWTNFAIKKPKPKPTAEEMKMSQLMLLRRAL